MRPRQCDLSSGAPPHIAPAEANELLRDRGIPEILECTPHTLRRTYISLLLAAGCDPHTCSSR
jgi:integrase